MSIHFNSAARLFLLNLALLSFVSLTSADQHSDTPKKSVGLIRSAKSGAWSAPTTWEGGKVPGAGARVQIREGHIVIYDAKSEQVIRFIHVAGTLSFASNLDTLLNVGLIKIQPGEDASENGFDCDAHAPAVKTHTATGGPALEVGSPTNPIDAKHTATIRLHYLDGMDKLSCPAIVSCGGRMDFHGTPMNRSWVKLGATANKGDDTVTLAEAVTGWRVGDRIIVTATTRDKHEAGSRRPGKGTRKAFTEERFVKAIDGVSLTLDKALDFLHHGDGEFRGEVANLTRNVVIESADPAKARGHTMYHHGSAGAISYAEFRSLGMEGVLGRYPIHFHLAGESMRGSYVLGASITDSGNRWVTIHGTNYLVVRDCVGFRGVGHGFFCEDGTEVYNVLDRNLAVQAFKGKALPKQVLPFDQNEGAGFWWANSLNTFTGNVSCENDRYGFRFEATRNSQVSLTKAIQQPDGTKAKVDIRTLPFVRFDDNEAHCDGLYGFNLGEGVDRVGPDTKHPFIIRRMKIWEIHYAFRVQSPSVLLEDFTIDRSIYGIYHPNFDNHVYRNLTINGNGEEPFNRGHDDISIQYGPLTVDGLTFTDVRGSKNQIPLIQMSDDNPTGKASAHFRNVKLLALKDKMPWVRPLVNTGGGEHVTPSTPTSVPIILHDYFGPNKHAKIASTTAKDFGKDGLKYRSSEPMTGHESRVAEVSDIEFPKLLDPVDDLPPTTVITHVVRNDGKLLVRGTTADNGTVTKVVVNGKEARATRANFAEWEITVDQAPRIEAFAQDAAGNVEKRAHVVMVR
jgi:G8 domain